MSDIKKIVIASVVIIAALALSFMAGQRNAQKRLILPQEERVDTLFILDTIVSKKPIYKEKKVTERILVPVHDTIRVKDTLFLYAEREQIHWKDSLSDVYASGIGVNVDSVRHYIPTKIVTKERDVIIKVKPKWSLGVQAGCGAFVLNGQISASPYIGVGVTYNLLSW
jgi:hypothetical protein